jgi:protein subunit release factor A
MIPATGVGRVRSSTTTAAVLPRWANWLSGANPIGWARARSKASSSVGRSSGRRGFNSAFTVQLAGKSIVRLLSLPHGTVIVVILLKLPIYQEHFDHS